MRVACQVSAAVCLDSLWRLSRLRASCCAKWNWEWAFAPDQKTWHLFSQSPAEKSFAMRYHLPVEVGKSSEKGLKCKAASARNQAMVLNQNPRMSSAMALLDCSRALLAALADRIIVWVRHEFGSIPQARDESNATLFQLSRIRHPNCRFTSAFHCSAQVIRYDGPNFGYRDLLLLIDVISRSLQWSLTTELTHLEFESSLQTTASKLLSLDLGLSS